MTPQGDSPAPRRRSGPSGPSKAAPGMVRCGPLYLPRRTLDLAAELGKAPGRGSRNAGFVAAVDALAKAEGVTLPDEAGAPSTVPGSTK